MEIDKTKLIENLNKIFAANENDVNYVRLWVSEPHVLSFQFCKFEINLMCLWHFNFTLQSSPDTINMEEILDFLNEKIIDAEYTTKIGANFTDILLLVVTKNFSFDVNDTNLHQRRCIALSKLLKYSHDIQRYVFYNFLSVHAIY